MVENAAQLNTQAIELASKGEYKEAIACFKKALSFERNNYLLWYNLGLTYRDSGDLLMAMESLEKAYSIESEDDEVIESLALVNYNLGLTQDAIKYCYEGIDLNPSNAHIWNTLGVIFYNQENYNQAASAFENAISINSYYYDALFNLRDTYMETGNQAGYLSCIEQMKAIKDSGQI
ncbi:MAG: tetratricopeptide repeat protein [Treponema sp.]|nr:tetratricopeptide repeat protein [Treponema sp.]